MIIRDGGTPRKIADNACYANWSPDGNYLLNGTASTAAHPQITDVRIGKSSALPPECGAESGFWLTQDVLVLRNERHSNFMIFNVKTQQLNALAASS